MLHRSTLALVAFADGALAWQRSWPAFVVGLVVALWLVLDEDAIESLDPDRADPYNHD